ncbi:NAD(P)(+)--arginine ADP-ribosyltransferase 2 [Anabarilius grahami]|uniref:NAD(P)(+)--arginine ADP-ribosyltransferase n=1 Tax=Anabarilius grahami TaxID=495550 RepID=A0A3N0XUT2_ANAGA|nr:NAD(P)(+)--arginine ADP-ribosyltransferase 2 [Anabarilius grahami]
MLLIIEALLLISAALVKDHRAAADGPFPVDMQLNSVDDDFKDCEKIMLGNLHLLKEKDKVNNILFKEAWEKDPEGSKQQAAGSKHQAEEYELKAIRIWTGKNKNIYGDFNEAVRCGKQKYQAKSYGWYTFHFLLTSVIRKLKKIQNDCVTTYRRTHSTFEKENVINTEVRFGSFASSSFDKQVISGFGEKSCFEIVTCFGAHLTEYSEHPIMCEVLIPPYETFKVKEIKEKKNDNNLWCDTVYKLESFRERSDLSCEIANIINSENNNFFEK